MMESAPCCLKGALSVSVVFHFVDLSGLWDVPRFTEPRPATAALTSPVALPPTRSSVLHSGFPNGQNGR